MIRLLGFVVGSAVSIALFLLVLGIPELKSGRDTIDEAGLAQVPDIIGDAKTDLGIVAEQVIDEVEAFSAPADGRQRETTAESEQGAALQHDDPIAVVEGAMAAEVPVAGDAPEPAGLKWHAFWNPFRSRIAAEGFVRRLEQVTGLDYRVVKIGTGKYEVTFAYENDEERRVKLAQIASATGLALPES